MKKIDGYMINNIKHNFIYSLVLIFVLVIFVSISRDSFANSVDENMDNMINLDLLYNEDINILRNNIYEHIDMVDNILIPNSSFNMSSILNENYDFLTNFSISFILDNKEYFDIVLGEEYKYIDEYGVVYTTNEYINIDKIYEITNKIFGVEYYYILNDYIKIDNDLVPLIRIENKYFDLDIDNIIDIDKNNNYIDVIVRYEDNIIDYVYRLEYIDNNRLIISNLSIRE